MLLALLAGLVACSRPAPEQRLREAIASMQAAAEARRPGEVVQWVAEDFSGSHGLDRDGLRRVVQAQMLRNASVGVTLGPLGIELDGDEAVVRFVAVVTGGEGRLLPERARGYRVVSRWRLEGADWRLYEARWEDDGGL